jgi:hypothetical protein
MSREAHSSERGFIDRHFDRRSTPEEEAAMRGHLATCDACRQYYERHLLVSDLDPKSAPAKERIAAGLGFAPGAKPPRVSRPFLTLAGAGAVFVVVLVGGNIKTRLEFTARSGGGAGAADGHGGFLQGGRTSGGSPELRIYVVPSDGPDQPEPLVRTIAATDELAFAYTNPPGFRWLMILGIDEERKIYWFHPAWNDQAADPSAVAIERGLIQRELPEAIGHAFTGKSLRIVGLFANHELTVRDVERVVDFAGCSSIGSRLGPVDCVETTVPIRPAGDQAPR